jgi:phosphatidylserine/phosphatidylglycerophosphate/cardiolipin synthase-like enzyme
MKKIILFILISIFNTLVRAQADMADTGINVISKTLRQTFAITSTLQVSALSAEGFSLSWKTNFAGTHQVFYGQTPAFELGVLAGRGPADTIHTVTLNGAAPSALFYVKAFSVRGNDTAFSETRAVITSSASSDMKIYFTSTVDNSVSTGNIAVQLDDAVDDTLISYINGTRETLDIAIYNFGLAGISDIASSINNAYNRGVRVRIIFDGSTANEGIESLNPGIPKIASPAGFDYGIMHNKFMVMDCYSDDPNIPVVWTGSTNWTSSNINDDANNVVIIQDESLAIAYTLEFEEMWGSPGPYPNPGNSRFGSAKTDNTPHEFIIGGKKVYCYFSPTDGVNQKIIETIETANSDLDVNTMLITRSDIGYALRDKKQAGIDTKVIVNTEGGCTETVLNTLAPALGSNFRIFGETGILHSKAMIVDQQDPSSDPQALTGSHNWSTSANDKNDENTLIIHDAAIANIFYQEFIARWANGIPLDIKDKGPAKSFIIYPNPSNGRFIIQLDEKTEGHVSLNVYDHTGHLVFRKDENIKAENKIKLDLQTMNTGIYFLEIFMNDLRFSEKLVIIRRQE